MAEWGRRCWSYLQMRHSQRATSAVPVPTVGALLALALWAAATRDQERDSRLEKALQIQALTALRNMPQVRAAASAARGPAIVMVAMPTRGIYQGSTATEWIHVGF